VAYEIRLDVFEGPIDLLLHLITRQRVDIYEVSLATITEEYLSVVASMDSLDLDATTGFLVVAATLLELKSARLLPRHASEEEDDYLLEQRDLLLARLVECATFRDAGAWIRGRLDDGTGFHPRTVAMEDRFVGLVPDLLATTRVEHVSAAAATLLAPRPAPILDTSHVSPITASVRDAIVAVAERLRGGDELAFESLCADTTERIEVVVRFLALLELYKAGAIDVTQGSTFGSIRARWTGRVAELTILDDVEEYTIAGEPR
jgi:segregation and condensation protein A